MPDAPPSRDRGHEALRLDILATVADMQQNAADTSDGLYLVDVLFELLDGALTQIEDLSARVTALEPPTP